MVSLDQWQRELREAARRAPEEVKPVVEKGAQNIKDDARRNVQVSAPVRNAHAQNAITYDISNDGLEAEIGYDKGIRGGSLGNLLEYGSRNSPPHRDLNRAADDEAPRFEQAIADVVDRLL